MQADWIIIAAALTGETRALIGQEQFEHMKPTARLINVARGPLVEEDALIDAVQSGRIAGTILDVFATEPLPAESPFWYLPNVYITPHNAPGWTTGLRRRQEELFVANLRRFLAKEPLDGIVDIERGY
jgi:phosphoglycerate dehydrogenase-like enzyme